MINRMRLAVRSTRMRLLGESGSALVETALTFPVLILMLLGAVQLGEVGFAAIETANAARAGAQYAGMNGGGYNDSAGITRAAQADARDTSSLTATPSSTCSCSDGSGSCAYAAGIYSCTTGKPIVTVTVQTTATFSSVISIPGFGSSYTLHGYAQEDVLN